VKRFANFFLFVLMGATAAALVLSAVRGGPEIAWFMGGFALAVFVLMFLIFVLSAVTE
jgi:hypothetical protein